MKSVYCVNGAACVNPTKRVLVHSLILTKFTILTEPTHLYNHRQIPRCINTESGVVDQVLSY